MQTAMTKVLLVVALSATGLGGCVNVDFKEPVTSFTSTMALSNATLLAYYANLNSFERELYLQRLADDPTLEVLEVDARRQRTGLIAQFSPESIKARTDAIALLAKYGERLAALAGADAPQRFNTGAQTLGTNLATLDETFRKLGSAPAEVAPGSATSTASTTAITGTAAAVVATTTDKTAAAYVAPIATIIGLIGEEILDRRRDQALMRAVNEGTKPVNDILDLLDKDLTTMISPLQETGQDQALTGLMVAYNRDRTTMTSEQRRAALDRINMAAARYEATVAQQPSTVISGIRDAHAALVAYANSPRRPEDLTSLIAALETFNNRIRPLADAVATLRDLDDG